MIDIVLETAVHIINLHHNLWGRNPVTVSISNNCEPIPVSFVRQRCTKQQIKDTYKKSNPHPGSLQQPDTQNIEHLSAFLQHHSWPLCALNPKCQKPTVIHHPDIAVVFEESRQTRPLGASPFRIPILICEIEGSKDVWGGGEQESKALEEALYSLAFTPINFLIFVYHNRWELISCKRNTDTSTIDLEQETVYLQTDGDNFQDKMIYIIKCIIKILVKQLTSGKIAMEDSVQSFRQNGAQPPTANINTQICNNCWVLLNPWIATLTFNQNPNNQPQFE